MTKTKIKIKRVYEDVDADDGTRVLVDRVWPRGIAKEKLKADLWMKDIAPSTDLRKWFNHDRSRWEPFKERYFTELAESPALIDELMQLASKHTLTLLYSAKDETCNQAVALLEYLQSRR